MRKGPHPLSVHIGMAAAEMARQSSLSHDQSAIKDPDLLAMMLRGVQRYQCYEGDITGPPLDCLRQWGMARLYCIHMHEYAPEQKPVLLVPSLINRAYILNLTQDRSMMAFFAQAGLAPYLLDWGESIQDDGQRGLDTLLTERLIPAVEFVHGRHHGGVHVMGYCMGGTLLMGVASLLERSLASLIFLAAPWDFHAGAAALQKRVSFWWPSAQEKLSQKEFLDQDWLQTIFASLDPLSTRDKFIRFAQMGKDDPEVELFVAIEDWLNDSVDLPAGVARACIQDWFFENLPAHKNWHVAGRRVDPSFVRTPALIVASHKDRLVEYDSAAALMGDLPQAQLVSPDCGHIGMIAGRKAVEECWKPMVQFIQRLQ